MSPDHSTATDWYFKRREDVADAKRGPYSWQDMVSFGAQGTLSPDDLVWHASLSDWTPAREIPQLLQAAPHAPAQSVRPRRTRIVLAVIASLLVVLVAGLIGFRVMTGDRGVAAGGPSLGVASVKLPDSAKLIMTDEWGEVPANQLCITLADGSKRKDAVDVAESLGGSVVGEIEFISVYQIEFPGESEQELRDAISKAEGDEAVAFAYPNEQDALDAEIWGVRQDPYNDPIYGGGAGEGYAAIGVSKAWSLIKGSGIGLNNVKVGVVDNGLYRPQKGKEGEFGGDVEVEYPDAAAGELANPEVWDDGSNNPAGSHGTGVSTIIGADPGNGGPAGVAGPLGKKLKISMINKYTGQYGQSATTTPDPSDPTKVELAPGKSYVLGSLVAIQKQVENNAKVINCSFGKTDGSAKVAAAYKKFFEKMAVDHPDVIFICSAGNDGKEVNGARRFPSGHALPNMVTVGAINNDGTLADYSNKATGNYEVTLAAPGTQAVVGIDPAGGASKQDGTSFAAPHVTAAAAILKSINPKLTAAEIKKLLTDSARTSLKKGDTTVNAPAETGGKILALDQAVFTLINQMRVSKGLSELTLEDMENLGVVDAVAKTGDPGEYAVRGIVKAVGEDGAELTIQVTGEDHAIGGKSTQALRSAGEAKWSVSLPKDEGVITVKRDDSGAASVITIERFDINGAWTGSFTITDVQITDEELANEEGCSLAALSELKGKAAPMTMDISVNEAGVGTGVGLIDIGSIAGEKQEADPQEYGVKLSGNSIRYTIKNASGYRMSSTITRQGETLVQNGTLSMTGPGFKMRAVFTLSKPDTGS